MDLHKALSTNATLAEHYCQQQVKFIHAKTLALRVIERKLEMESSLRDHKQVLIMLTKLITPHACARDKAVGFVYLYVICLLLSSPKLPYLDI